MDFQPAANATGCLNLTDCLPGSKVSVFPTATSDRQCSPCPPETFADTTNSPTCTPCPHGTFQPSPGMPMCIAAGCPPGTRGAGQICIECAGGTYQDQAGQDSCKPAATCLPGWYVAVAATSTADADCNPCSPGTHAGTPNAANCSKCILGQTFQPHPGQPSCEPVRTCRAGEFVVVPPTATSDRTCSACPASTFSDHDNAGSCTPCPNGSFSGSNSSSCTPHTACRSSQIALNLPNATTDRQCTQVRNCEQGTYITVHLNRTAMVQRECQKCPAGTMSKGVNNANCTSCEPNKTYQHKTGKSFCYKVRTCSPGFRVHRDPTLESNRACRRCWAGTWSNVTNARECTPCDGDTGFNNEPRASECKPTTQCQPGEYVTVRASRTRDRVCAPCPAGTVSSQVNAPACAPCDGVTGYSAGQGGVNCSVMTPPCVEGEVEVRTFAQPRSVGTIQISLCHAHAEFHGDAFAQFNTCPLHPRHLFHHLPPQLHRRPRPSAAPTSSLRHRHILPPHPPTGIAEVAQDPTERATTPWGSVCRRPSANRANTRRPR